MFVALQPVALVRSGATAYADRQEKARDLAGAVNAQPVRVLNIDEISWSYYGSPWQSGRSQAITQNVIQNASGSAQPPSDDEPISLGQITVQAEMQARFGLK